MEETSSVKKNARGMKTLYRNKMGVLTVYTPVDLLLLRGLGWIRE